MSRQILSGWKQISNHIQRGVRTAQRWEALLGMPVHRPALKDRTAVVAFSDELEHWLSRTSPDAREECVAMNDKEKSNESLLRVLDDMGVLVRQSWELIYQMRVLQEQPRRSRRIRHRIASRTRARTPSTPARARGSVLSFPRRKRGLPLESKQCQGIVEQSGWAPGPQKSTVHEAGVDFADRAWFEKAR